jgi:hypothetical protein
MCRPIQLFANLLPAVVGIVLAVVTERDRHR